MNHGPPNESEGRFIWESSMFLVITTFFVVTMAPSIACLAYCWRLRFSVGASALSDGWRPEALRFGLYFATLSQILATAFLIHAFHGDRQSFVEPQSFRWLVANWITVTAWAFSIAGTAVGKGRGRRALFVWILITPLAAWLVVMVGMDY